jgi:membrane-anchored protein YejM (alkaline phosphatase superfamily)
LPVVQILGWQTWMFAGIYLLILLVAQSMLARWLWQALSRRSPLRIGPLAGLFLLSCVLLGQNVYIWADAYYFVPITSFSRYLPLSISMTANRNYGYRSKADKTITNTHPLPQRAEKLNHPPFFSSMSTSVRFPQQPHHV